MEKVMRPTIAFNVVPQQALYDDDDDDDDDVSCTFLSMSLRNERRYH